MKSKQSSRGFDLQLSEEEKSNGEGEAEWSEPNDKERERRTQNCEVGRLAQDEAHKDACVSGDVVKDDVEAMVV